MANTNTNTNTNTNAPKGTTNAPKGTTNAPKASALPAANVFAAPSGRSTTTVVCTPGTTYGIACPHNGGTVVLPFALPATCKAPVPVVLASTNANWLGRDGAKLAVWVHTSHANPAMGVALQPHASNGGYKANAYTQGMHATTH